MTVSGETQSNISASKADASPAERPSSPASGSAEADSRLPDLANLTSDADAMLDVGLDQPWLETPLNEGTISSTMTCEMSAPYLFFGDLTHLAFTDSSDSSPSLTGSMAEGIVNPASTGETASIESSLESFPDSYLLPVNELTLLRALLRIATRLGAQSVWELTANSSFNQGTAPPTEQLPKTWQPTVSQILMPHHPVLDFLPWPAVRDRIITVTNLPDDARPPTARGPLAVVQFSYDLEDGAEGIRIWGSDPYDSKSWEVGQVLFERWWFIFDREVIDQSNHWRQLRGAPPLCLTAGESSSLSTASAPPTDVSAAE
jgi:hypothetical protein